MPGNLLFSFIFYALISGITPGPANLCSLATSLKYGWRVALKQWTGLFAGFTVVSFASAFLCYFVGSVMGEYVKYLSYVGVAYLMFLAIKMLKSSISDATASDGEVNFFTGLLVNVTNVKIMVYCTTTFSIYVLPYSDKLSDLLIIAAILPFTGPICNLVWLFLGDALRRFFTRWQKQVNIAMAIALMLCAMTLLL